MMKKIGIIVIVVAGLCVSAQASVIIDYGSDVVGWTFSLTNTLSDLTSDPITYEEGHDEINSQLAIGNDSFSDATGYAGTIKLIWTAAETNFNAASWTGTAAEVGADSIGLGVRGGKRDWEIGEVLIVTFDLSGLTSTGSKPLAITSVKYENPTDTADIWKLVDGSGSNVVNSHLSESALSLEITDGATYAFIANDRGRLDSITLDTIPEPATVVLFAAVGAGLFFIRRKMSI